MPTTTSEEPVISYPDIDTGEMFPPDSWRCAIPQTVDVFLPGRVRVRPFQRRILLRFA